MTRYQENMKILVNGVIWPESDRPCPEPEPHSTHHSVPVNMPGNRLWFRASFLFHYQVRH